VAGLLTFPSLLYLPEPLSKRSMFNVSVALYKQASLMGITAAGTVPDSHRIPLHHGGFCPQIAFVGAKVRISEQTAKEKCVFLLFFRAKVPSTVAKGTNNLSISHQFPNYFVLLRHEIAISHCSAYQWLGQDNGCTRSDGVADGEGLSGAAFQMWSRLHRHEVS
jgi:hypothetical protein